MPQIQWTSDLEIGIGVIDGQHRRIVDYINALDASDGGTDRATVARVLDDLIDYTYSHFAFEEALMEEAGYEYLSIHQKTHQAFVTRVDGLKQRFNDGEDVAADVAELLRTWLISHIMNDDTSYAPVVREMMPRIEAKDQGSWLGRAVRRFFGP
jgi:hemerythrin